MKHVTVCRSEGEAMPEDNNYVWDHYTESVKVNIFRLKYMII